MSDIKFLSFEKNKHLKKTKILLINGLLDLIKEHDINRLTISEICHHSQVGRRTFYRHYEKKEDIIHEYISLLILDFVHGFNESRPSNYNEAVHEFFSFWNSHRDFLNLLRKNRICYMLISAGESTIDSDLFLTETGCPLQTSDEYKLKMTFLIAGSFRVLQRWVYSDMKLSNSEVSDIVLSMLNLP